MNRLFLWAPKWELMKGRCLHLVFLMVLEKGSEKASMMALWMVSQKEWLRVLRMVLWKALRTVLRMGLRMEMQKGLMMEMQKGSEKYLVGLSEDGWDAPFGLEAVLFE